AAAWLELTPEELHLVRMGKKINAIKIYRDRTGVSLADAKAAIDAVG
ncbi:MAG: 50S ribosomal protein L7/L12, partial [Actinomyces graevenitzii]|nr:50S ribosomal protein L7/L12 [Actinomyces graevenitzii]